MLKKISTVNKSRNSEDRISSHHQNSTSTKHSSTFESVANHILNSPHHVKKHQQHEQITKEDPQPDMNTCIIDNANRKQFTKFLRQLNPKLEHLLFFYMLISSVKTRAASTSLIGNDEIKKALKAAHKSYEEQKLGSFLSGDVREKMNDTLRKLVYNEAVFSTVEREVNDILEAYYPSFLNSAFYKAANSSNVSNKQKSFIQDETITSSKMIRPHERAPSFNYTGKQYMPINPYHAPSYPLHGSRQDSEVQSMVSMAYSEASTVHNTNRLSKLDPVIKKSLEANEHLKNAAANISTLTLEMSQMSMTGLSHPHAHQVAAEKRKHSIAQNALAQSNCQEIARQIIEKLESYIRSFGKRVIYDESKRDKVAELPLPVHLRDSVPLYNEDDGQEVDEMMQPNMKVNHHGLKQSESVNQSNPEQKTNYQTYLFTFTSKENDIENLQLQQQQQQQHQSQNHHHQHKKPSHIAALNLDSGISTKSADSLDRVQDWLDHTKVSATTLPNEASSHVITEKQPTMIQHSVPEKPAAKPAVAEKIPVVYKVPGEEQPYMSYFNGKTITLGQFKDLINKKGAYKYFFMNVCKLFEEETVLYEEITDENQIVPLFKGKVMAKIQSID